MVFSKTFFLLVLSLSAVAAPPSILVAGPSSGCSAVHIITARASTEAPGEGIIGSVVSAVVQGSSQTVSRESVNYPATLTNYDSSESLGVTDMRNKLAAQARSCPNTKIVLMGYSQGAQVAGTPCQVAAVILMGDPAHVAGESFQKGTANNRNGIFPRSNHGLEQFSAKIASFCDTGDEFCASGLSLPVHLGYVQEYGSQATAFVLGRIGG
ncbi:cutinase [Mycena leptocephala]|nr:cutinase [Mycena leptocephala]